MAVWFSADSHHGHANIIKYANRDFPDVETMDEVLIERWNSLVRPGDIVWHLGDFALTKPEKVIEYRKRLTGQIHLILGNHDREKVVSKAGFASINKLKTVKIGETILVLCHFAMRVWDRQHYGSCQLYGHSHGTLKDDPNLRSMDVGVDCHQFYPISLETVLGVMKTKSWIPIDHHGKEEEEDGSGAGEGV